MHTRFHLMLTTGLATMLGAAMAWTVKPLAASAYPSAPAVSLGSNPVMARGGYISPGSTVSSITAPEDQVLIITDVLLTMYGYSGSSACLKRVTFDTSEGTIAEYRLVSDTDYSYDYLQPTQVAHSYSSGLPLQPGDTLVLTHHSGGGECDVSYSLSGYYAQP